MWLNKYIQSITEFDEVGKIQTRIHVCKYMFPQLNLKHSRVVLRVVLYGPLIETCNDWFGSGRLPCLAIGFVWLKNDNC